MANLQVKDAGNTTVYLKADGAGSDPDPYFVYHVFSGVYNVTPPSLTNGQKATAQLDASGNLKVNVVAGGAAGGTSSSFAAVFPAAGTAVGYSDGTNMQSARVFDADTGAGTQYVLGALIKKPGSGGAVDFGTSADPVRVDPTGATTQPVRLNDGVSFYDGAKTGQLPTSLGQKTMANSVGVVIASDQSAVTFNIPQSNVTADYDTGAGTQNLTMFGLALPASGGAVAGGTATNPVRTDPTGATTQPVSGTVTANAGTGTFAIQATAASPGSVRLSDGAAFYDTAKTGQLPSSLGQKATANSLSITLSSDHGGLPAGTNNIGDVDVLTQPARSRTTDHIGAAMMTDTIMNGTTALTPKFAAIAAATSGDNTLVAAVASKKIRVLSLAIVTASAVNLYFTSAAAGTVIFGGSTNKMNFAANGGIVLPFNPAGWFENSAVNQALVMNLSGAVSVSGGLQYVEV